MCQTALCQVRGLPLDWTENEMPYFRQKMTLELLQKEIM